MENVDFVILELLAEAAEKYEVFAAMNICNVRMRWVSKFSSKRDVLS
jgi:hypothetical protein